MAEEKSISDRINDVVAKIAEQSPDAFPDERYGELLAQSMRMENSNYIPGIFEERLTALEEALENNDNGFQFKFFHPSQDPSAVEGVSGNTITMKYYGNDITQNMLESIEQVGNSAAPAMTNESENLDATVQTMEEPAIAETITEAPQVIQNDAPVISEPVAEEPAPQIMQEAPPAINQSADGLQMAAPDDTEIMAVDRSALPIDQRIADIVYGVGENSVESYGGVREMSEETSNKLIAHLTHLSESDPNFEAKLELLEKTNTAIGMNAYAQPGEDLGTGVSAKGYHGYMLAVSENDLANPDFNFMDSVLHGIGEFQVSEAEHQAGTADPSSFHFDPMNVEMAEARFLNRADWIQEAQRAGIEGLNIPNFGSNDGEGSVFRYHKVEEGQIVPMDRDELMNFETTTVPDMNVSQADQTAAPEPAGDYQAFVKPIAPM